MKTNAQLRALLEAAPEHVVSVTLDGEDLRRLLEDSERMDQIRASVAQLQGKPLLRPATRPPAPLCAWCGEPYAAHVDSREPGEAVPRNGCGSLKAYFRRKPVDSSFKPRGGA